MLNPGAILQNRYQIIRALGAGGQGAVYLALHLGLNQYVALKENFSTDPAADAQFQTEANILAHLSHPNLPRVTDFFIESSGGRYLVMDFVEGQNLEEIVQSRGALDENMALGWMRQILEAVKYLHANHIIHRDINPRNIVITPSGKAMLVDFGIAKVFAQGQRTMTGASGFGSPGYAPPEQYSGGTDERSDIYALGATLYYVLTGRIPPDAPMRAAGTPLTPPRQFNTQVSPNTETVILTAMQLSAAQRYVAVSMLEQALLAFSATAPVSPQALLATSQPRGMNWWIPIGALAIFLLIPLFFAVNVLFKGTAITPAPVPPTNVAFATPSALPTLTAPPITTVTPNLPSVIPTLLLPTATRTPILPAATTTWTAVPTDMPPPSPSLTRSRILTPIPSVTSHQIVFASRHAGKNEINTINPDGTNRRTLVSYSWYAGLPCWSPDGRVIAFAAGQTEGQILTMFADGSNLQNLTNGSSDDGAPAWSPDGRFISFQSDRSGSYQIYVMNTDGSNSHRLTNDPSWAGPPNWSPDGRFVAFESGRDGNAEIYVMNADGSNVRRLTNNQADDLHPVWSPDGRFIAFYSKRDGNSEIYVMNADGSNQRRLTFDSAENVEPTWSYDMRLIAFASNQSGNYQIYVMNTDGTDLHRITNSTSDDRAPAWSWH